MFKLKNYLSYLNIKSQSKCDLPFLTEIAWKHLKKFKYQNTLLYIEGKKVVKKRDVKSINLDKIYQQMVVKKQPGYCFQNAELLYGALFELGFNVKRHIAKVFNKKLDNKDIKNAGKRPVDHEVLVVSIDGSDYLVDSGFANNSLRKPLPLIKGKHNGGKGDAYRLTKENSNWFLELKVKDDYLCLYQVISKPCKEKDIIEANEQLFKDERVIPIRDQFLKFARVTEKKRKCLVHFKKKKIGFFKSFKDGKLYKQREISKSDALKKTAEEKFGIKLPNEI